MTPTSPSQPEPANIDIQIDDAYLDQAPAEHLRRVVQAVLRHEGAADAEVTVVIADDALLQQLNRDYRGIDAPTDVLSFAAQEENEGPAVFVSAPEAANYLGDVVISFPTAQRQAGAEGHAVLDELSLLTVHGVLHLFGYDHADEQAEADMWARQAAILASVPRQP